MKHLSLILLLTQLPFCLIAQDFANNDLDGSAVNGGSAPYNWQFVPASDPNCMASWIGGATPDVTDSVGPSYWTGVMGNPYSGSTFVSGLFGGFPAFFQEGIMQTVSGFDVGQVYTVNFFQSVVKQYNAVDTSGSWVVYVDNSFVGISQPTSSQEYSTSTNIPWEHRSLSFLATTNTHTIKFLPYDDDSYHISIDSLAPVRMGIDSIYITRGGTLTSIPEATVNVALHPNPTSGKIELELGNVQAHCEVIVRDISGRIVTQQSFAATEVKVLNIPGPQGVYMVEIIADDRRYGITRVLKR